MEKANYIVGERREKDRDFFSNDILV